MGGKIELLGGTTKPDTSPDCIALLEQALSDAKLGKVASCAVIACGPADFGVAFAGPDAARLNLGLDTLKAQILARVSAPVQSSVIMRPGRGR